MLAPAGVATIEFPHLLRLIDGQPVRHDLPRALLLLLVPDRARRCSPRTGSSVFDVDELPTHGGSLRLYAQRAATGRRAGQPRVPELCRSRARARLRHARGAHLGFAARVEETKCEPARVPDRARAETGKRVAGYGAPGKGNTLLNYCGIRTDLLDYTVDRNPYKQGRFLPGTHIPIRAPAGARPESGPTTS